jgi:hypothetical protein
MKNRFTKNIRHCRLSFVTYLGIMANQTIPCRFQLLDSDDDAYSFPYMKQYIGFVNSELKFHKFFKWY